MAALVVAVLAPAWAAPSPGQQAETLRAGLIQAQLELATDPSAAHQTLVEAASAWQTLSPLMNEVAAEVAGAFAALEQALESGDEVAFARARSELWTALLRGSYQGLVTALGRGDIGSAQIFLSIREFRRATRFSAPGADATLALAGLEHGDISTDEALTAVRADLLGSYQARLNDTLHDLAEARTAGFRVREAELLALAGGYFELLAPSYQHSRGKVALERARAAFAAGDLNAVEGVLAGFQAAPLSPRERDRRAAQTLRFLDLVPVEYARGVSGRSGAVRVTNPLEITEAVTFRDSAAAAFADLEPLLVERDPGGVQQAKILFAALERGLKAAQRSENPPSAEELGDTSAELAATLVALIPADWRKTDPAGDLEVIRQQLDALESAVAQGRYDLAERARIDAYAILESGPEARLRVFMPQLSARIEALFWYGAEPAGLARLLHEGAGLSELRASLQTLKTALDEAARYLEGEVAPAVTGANAAVIVFREGLEAVLILAALLGSLKRPEVRRYRKPLWWGAALALGATAATWFVMRGLLTQFARYGEKLEAIVSIIAVAVLLLIMNWFFHQVYWTDHLANFHKRKQSLLGGSQQLGLVLLGLSAIYREGFETVLFLQSLVLQASLPPVLAGIGVGLAATLLVGVIIFVVQAKLPYKKMLVATGLMICLVLAVMVGNTAHVLQLVGWFPVHPLPVGFPYWLNLWFGTYATYEGLALQITAVAAVIGSYFVAEGLKKPARHLHKRQPI